MRIVWSESGVQQWEDEGGVVVVMGLAISFFCSFPFHTVSDGTQLEQREQRP